MWYPGSVWYLGVLIPDLYRLSYLSRPTIGQFASWVLCNYSLIANEESLGYSTFYEMICFCRFHPKMLQIYAQPTDLWG